MIDFQWLSSSICTDWQKLDEQTMGSRRIRLLTDEMSQMRRELRTLQWSLVGMILLMIFLCRWMSRMRRSLNNSTTTSTNGTSVETTSVQSSPPESPVMSPRSEATTEFVCVSNAVSSPSARTARYRRNMSVTPTLPQETLVSCFHRSHELLPGSNAVSVYLTCLDCRHHAKWTHRTRPHSSNFRNCSKRFKRGGQNCNDDQDDVLVPAGGCWTVLCMRRMEQMPVRPILRLWTPFTPIPGTVVTMWSSVFRERVGETVLTWCSLAAR